MKGSIEPIFSVLVCAGALWLGLLWVGTRLIRGRRGPGMKVGAGIATAVLLFAPLSGVPLWSWAFSFFPNPSLPILGMIGAALWRHLGGVSILGPADWRATWIFGAVAGTVLYLHPWFFGTIDLYYWGWHREVAVGGLAAFTVLLLACGNRLGLLFLGALIAYRLEALESQNCWDYVIDPFYWLVGLALGCADVFRTWRARGERRETLSAAVAYPQVE